MSSLSSINSRHGLHAAAKAFNIQGYDQSRNRELMSSLTARHGLTQQESALVLSLSKGSPISTASLEAGYSAVETAYQALRRPHVLAALHREVQQALVSDAPVSFRVLRKIRDDEAAPARVRADVAHILVKLAGHVQPTNRDRAPEKQLSEMSREEMIQFIDRNQAEIDKAVDELAARAKDVSAQVIAQDSDPTPAKPLSFLE